MMAGRAGSAKKAKDAAPANRSGTDEVTKKALLDATAEILAERSNLEFSQAEVGARSGMSAALVQYHFGSKHGLLAALLEYSSTHYVEQINGLADMTMSAVDKLRLHVRGAINNGVTRDEIKEVFLAACVYAGIPAGLDAFKVAAEVFREMDAA